MRKSLENADLNSPMHIIVSYAESINGDPERFLITDKNLEAFEMVVGDCYSVAAVCVGFGFGVCR